MKPIVVELGMGVDLHGQNATKAAQRAVRNAVERISLPGLRAVAGLSDPNRAIVEVTIAVPVPPEEVDTAAVLALLPFGQKSIRVVPGGMLASSGVVIAAMGDKTDDIVVANACITVGIPD